MSCKYLFVSDKPKQTNKKTKRLIIKINLLVKHKLKTICSGINMKTCYKSRENKEPTSLNREMGEKEAISCFPKPTGV